MTVRPPSQRDRDSSGQCRSRQRPGPDHTFHGEVAALDKAEAGCAIAGQDFARLTAEQARQDENAAAPCKLPQAGGELQQRLGQDVGHHGIEGRPRIGVRRFAAIANGQADAPCHAVLAAVLARDRDGDGIDVGGGGPGAMREGFGGGDGEHAGAGAEIEDGTRFDRGGQRADGQEATLRRAVVRGAESAARIDLDGPLRDGAGAVVAAVYDEAAGAHRRQRLLRLRDPVGVRDCRDGLGARREAHICKGGREHARG